MVLVHREWSKETDENRCKFLAKCNVPTPIVIRLIPIAARASRAPPLQTVRGAVSAWKKTASVLGELSESSDNETMHNEENVWKGRAQPVLQTTVIRYKGP